MTDRSGLSSRRTAAALVVAMALAAVLFAEALHLAPRRETASARVPVVATVEPARRTTHRARARHRSAPMRPRLVPGIPAPVAADGARMAGPAPTPAAPETAAPAAPVRRRARNAHPVVEPSVAATAAPRTVQLVSIPVPNQISPRDTVNWHVTPTGRAEVLSPADGTMPPSHGERSVLLVTRVPAGAPAGVTHVATTQFDGGGASVDVPVDLNVTRVRRADVRLVRAMYATRPGERFSLEVQLINRGNGSDTLAVHAGLPAGWQLVHPEPAAVLRPGQQRTVRVTVQVPISADAARSYVHLSVDADDARLAEATADVEVLDPVLQGRHGPVLTAALASVLGDSIGAIPVMSLDLSGFYDERTTVTGHLARAFDQSDINNPGLGRVGLYLGQAYFNIANPQWQATVGATGRNFTKVSGMNAYGIGFSGAVNAQQWHAAALAAAPSTGSSGHLLGGEVGYNTQAGQVTATVTDLQEGGIFPRALQTAGVGFESRTVFDTRFSAATAWRDFMAGSGLGWTVSADRQSRHDFASLAVDHTPGGAAAYAQATDQLSASASRQVNARFNVHGSYSHAQDDEFGANMSRSHNWSLGSGFLLSPLSTLNVDVNGDQYTTSGAVIGLENSDVTATAVLRTRIRRFDTEFSLGAGQIQRATTTAGFSSSAPAATQVSLGGSMGWTTARGRFGASASYAHSGIGSGYLPNALTLGVTASGLTVSSNPRVPTFEASVQRQEWFGSRAGATIVRVGTVIPLGDAYRLRIDVERNPFLHADRPNAPIVAAIKLERSFVLPFSHRSVASRGVVYEDLNGNGVRDPNEPGLGGVMVRRGGEVAISDDKGDFRLFDRDPRPAGIDATSLALGAVPGSAKVLANGAIDLPVVPTSALEVSLVPGADELGRVPMTKDFSPVVIVARDANGTVWTAQSDSTGHARIDALPPGRYTITADFTALQERLRTTGAPPIVAVRAGEPLEPVHLPVVPFTVKIFNALGAPPSHLAKEPK